MGTSVRVIVYMPPASQAPAVLRAAFEEIELVDALMSDYRADSELSRLNAAGQLRVAQPFFDVLQASRRMWAASEGAFDVTVGPVVQLWRKARKERTLPPADELRGALERVGSQHLELGPERKARLHKVGMRLDVGGIAKGYACDRAVAKLRRMGVSRVLVDAGGDMALGDPPPGQKGWRIQVAGTNHVLVASNCGIATSGDTEQFVEIEGRRYSHIVDPRTGMGVEHMAGVTVIAKDGMNADALATAVSVLGPEKGIELIERQDAAGLIRYRTGDTVKELPSRGFERWKE